jgi:hypothetical protein
MKRLKSSNTKASFGTAERMLAVLFGLGIILGFLLTPLGFETRINELRTYWFAAFFIIVGVLFPIAGLVSLFLKPKLAGILAVIAAAFSFLIPPADEARFFFTIPRLAIIMQNSTLPAHRKNAMLDYLLHNVSFDCT